MEFNIYNQKNCRIVTREPSVRLTKGGVIMINTSAMNKMELIEGNCISIAQDKKNLKDWYIFRDADGIKIKSKSGTTKSFGIQSRFLCYQILESLGLPKNSTYTFRIAPVATEVNQKPYWALLTSKAQ